MRRKSSMTPEAVKPIRRLNFAEGESTHRNVHVCRARACVCVGSCASTCVFHASLHRRIIEIFIAIPTVLPMLLLLAVAMLSILSMPHGHHLSTTDTFVSLPLTAIVFGVCCCLLLLFVFIPLFSFIDRLRTIVQCVRSLVRVHEPFYHSFHRKIDAIEMDATSDGILRL